MRDRGLWTCASCRADNLVQSIACRRCGAGRTSAGPRSRRGPSAGFAATLSGLLPGLGQLYAGRYFKAVLMFLLPILALALIVAFLLIESITASAVRHANLVALLIVGGLFAYHVVIVGDAFAVSRGASAPGRRNALDYALLAVVVLALVGVYGVVHQQSSAWAGLVANVFAPVAKPVPSVEDSPPPQWTGRERLNILLLGIDSRDGSAETQNTDTLIVLSLDPVRETAAMLSIPRDTLVTIPGVGEDKINAAYSYGGPQRGPDLARRTVEGLLGISIHSYALIDFEAFTRIIDAVGGILVDVQRPLRDPEYPGSDFGVQPLQMLAGPQLLNGEDALKYARSRHDSNDFSRAARQQDVISGLRSSLASGGFARLPAIIDRVGSAVQTNFDPGNVLPLARIGLGVERSDIRSEVLLPCGGPSVRCELREVNNPAGYYLIPDMAAVRALVRELFPSN